MIVFLICKYIYFNTSTIIHLHRTADEPAVRLPRRPRPRHSQSGSTPARRPFASTPTRCIAATRLHPRGCAAAFRSPLRHAATSRVPGGPRPRGCSPRPPSHRRKRRRSSSEGGASRRSRSRARFPASLPSRRRRRPRRWSRPLRWIRPSRRFRSPPSPHPVPRGRGGASSSSS